MLLQILLKNIIKMLFLKQYYRLRIYLCLSVCEKIAKYFRDVSIVAWENTLINERVPINFRNKFYCQMANGQNPTGHTCSCVKSRLLLRNTGGRLREVYPLRWKTNRRRRKRTLLGTSVADKLTKAILPRPSRPPHYRKPVDSGTIYTVKSPTIERGKETVR